MTRRWRQIAGAVAGSAALALGTAACGDDEPDTASVTPQAEQDETPAGGAAEQEQTPAGGSAEQEQTPDDGSVEQPQPVTGGSTTLRLEGSARRALDAVGVEIEPVGEASLEDGRFRFPISGGSVDVDTPSGAIEHEGGLRFSAGGRSLEARDLVLEPGEDVVTADVAGERVPLLAVDVDALTVPSSGRIVLPGRAAALSSSVLPELEQQLGVRLPDLRLGRIEVSAET